MITILFGLARLANAKIALLGASIAILVTLASCGALPGGTGPTTKLRSSSHNGKIAFARWDNRVGHAYVFVMKANGTGVRKLASKPAQNINNPAWSPDGKRLAFEAVSPHSSNVDIYIMNADGSGLKRITKELLLPTQDRMPSWSPDGTRIAFMKQKRYIPFQASGNIYTMRADGTDLRQLTDEGADEFPAWSPDGKTIAFDRVTKSSGGIYTVNSDGGGLRRLTDPPKDFSDVEPSWSPDGTKIAFSGGSEGGRSDVFMMNADGTHRRKLTGRVDSISPDFSPDGKKIVFVGWEGGGEKLYVMNADGTNARRLTKTQPAIYEGAPDWQPLP